MADLHRNTKLVPNPVISTGISSDSSNYVDDSDSVDDPNYSSAQKMKK